MKKLLSVIVVLVLALAGFAVPAGANSVVDFKGELTGGHTFSAPGEEAKVSIKVSNSGNEEMPGPVRLYYPDKTLIEDFGTPTLAAGTSRNWEGTWKVTQEDLDQGAIWFYISYPVKDEATGELTTKLFRLSFKITDDKKKKSDDFENEILVDGTTELTKYLGKDEELVIPEVFDRLQVTGIGDYAFSGNSSLKSIMIPDSVTRVGDNPFRLCDSLKDIKVSLEHPYLATINGVLFSKPDKRLICYPCIYTNKTYAIPDGIQIIGGYAFDNCDSLVSIDIPNSVTSIGDHAFNGCKSLTSIVIPDSVTEMKGNPFGACTSLKKLKISPDHPYLAEINGVLFSKPDKRLICYPCAFENETYTIPDGIQIIEDYAFGYCKSLKSIDIPESVTSIGEAAFEGCTSLTSIVIPDGVTSIGEDTFYGCSSLTSIDIPDSVISIGEYVFSRCSSLKSIDIPDSVTSIGNKAFSGCSSLTSIDIPDSVTSIGENAFFGCSSLTSIEIPNGVTNIGNSAFDGCSSLTSIDIPNGVTSIGRGAFSQCKSLKAINIPDSVTSIGRGAFSQCKSLKAINIPDSVTSIGENAFRGCDALTVTVPRNSYAAQYCKENNINYIYPDSLDWLNN